MNSKDSHVNKQTPLQHKRNHSFESKTTVNQTRCDLINKKLHWVLNINTSLSIIYDPSLHYNWFHLFIPASFQSKQKDWQRKQNLARHHSNYYIYIYTALVKHILNIPSFTTNSAKHKTLKHKCPNYMQQLIHI